MPNPDAVPGFPPLPPGSRLHVEAAEFAPEPRLELAIYPVRGPRRRAETLVAGACAISAVFFGLGLLWWAWDRGPAALLVAAYFVVFGPAVAAYVMLGRRRGREPDRLRAGPDGLDSERLWRRRPATRSRTPAAGGRLRVRVAGADGLAGPLRVFGVPATPRLSPPDRAWVLAALARLRDAGGVPFDLPDPPLTAVPPGGARVDHPALRVLRDDPGRLELDLSARAGPAWRRAGPAAFAALSGAAPACVALLGSVPTGIRVGFGVAAVPALAAGLLAARGPFRPVPLTVSAEGVGIDRGPLFGRRVVPPGEIAAVAVSTSDAVPKPVVVKDADAAGVPAAALVLRGGEVVRLTPARSVADPARFAAALAGRIADRLAAHGNAPPPPADWRFGWRAGQDDGR